MKLLIVLLVFGFVKECVTFPMCTNGEPPLMERNDAFSCDKGCPMGFICEFQGSDERMESGICCANETALMEIYGDMMRIEPVWSVTETAEPMSASTTHMVSPPGLKPPKGVTFPPPNKDEEEARQYKNPFGVTVSLEEKIETTTGPQPPPLTPSHVSAAEFEESSEEPHENSSSTEAEDKVKMELVSVPKDSDESQKHEDSSIDADTKDAATHEESSEIKEELAKNSGEEEKDKSKTIVEKLEPSPKENNTHQEGMSVVESLQEVTVNPVEKDETSDESKVQSSSISNLKNSSESDESDEESSENTYEPSEAKNEEEMSSFDTNPPEDFESDRSNADSEADSNYEFEEKSNSTILAPQDSSNSSSLLENIEEVSQLPDEMNLIVPPEPEKRENTSDISKDAVDLEALAILMDDKVDNSTMVLNETENIVLDSQNITEVSNSTELEEFGEKQEQYSCDRQIYKFTCQLGAVKTQPTIRWAWNVETNTCEFYPWGYCPGDRVKNSTTIRTKEECLNHCSRKLFKSVQDTSKAILNDSVQGQGITYHAKVSFDSPKVSVSLARKTVKTVIDQDEATSDNLLPIITTDPALVHVIAVTDPRSEAKSLLNIEEVEEGTTMKTTTKPSTSNKKKPGVYVEPNPEQNEVLCTETPYRYVCASGMPSQFVYRWQVIDGKCRSFPYGYCWGEHNHSHPRSRAECQKYCPVGLPTNYFRVL